MMPKTLIKPLKLRPVRKGALLAPAEGAQIVDLSGNKQE